MTLALTPNLPMLPIFAPEHDDERIGLELRRIRKEKFGARGSLAKVAREADVSVDLTAARERLLLALGAAHLAENARLLDLRVVLLPGRVLDVTVGG